MIWVAHIVEPVMVRCPTSRVSYPPRWCSELKPLLATVDDRSEESHDEAVTVTAHLVVIQTFVLSSPSAGAQLCYLNDDSALRTYEPPGSSKASGTPLSRHLQKSIGPTPQVAVLARHPHDPT